MFEYSDLEVRELLVGAANINAALKKLLKHEIEKGHPAERYIKRLREALAAPATGLLDAFLSNRNPTFEPYLVAVGAYAYGDLFNSLSGEVIDHYAEEFNSTYTVLDGNLMVTDRGCFERIIVEVFGVVENQLQASALAGNAFARRIILERIFDETVLPEALRVLAAAGDK